MEFPFILNDFILIISSISQFADFIFPRVSANVIIPEKTFLEAKMKRDVETDFQEPMHCKINYSLCETNDFPLQNYKNTKDIYCYQPKTVKWLKIKF